MVAYFVIFCVLYGTTNIIHVYTGKQNFQFHNSNHDVRHEKQWKYEALVTSDGAST
jgi:hypothetical protein